MLDSVRHKITSANATRRTDARSSPFQCGQEEKNIFEGVDVDMKGRVESKRKAKVYLKQRGEVLDNRAKHNALQDKVRTAETGQVDRLRTAPPPHGESMPTEHESKNDSQFDPSLQCTDQT